MDVKEEEGGMNINRQRKYGLPSWMVNNIERLNYVTDFEQYGSSPPEHESFLNDAMRASSDICQTESNVVDSKNLANEVSAKLACPPRIIHPTPLMDSLHPRLLRPEDQFSSPGSTPCATPEPSPVIRRKVSIPSPNDTVLTNPGGWFYLGKVKKAEPGKKVDAPDGNKKPALKLVISNFDLNAVSPTSW